MGIYNDFGWGTGSAYDPISGVNQPFGTPDDDVLYGQAARLVISVEPFRAIATDYDKAFLTWSVPQGAYDKIRLVRSNDGFPETSEDGIILWEYDEDIGGTKIAEWEDGVDAALPLASGRFVYYRMWVRLPNKVWKVAGDAYALIPTKHSTLAPDGTELVSTQNKVVDFLPRVYTSASQSPIDEVDETTDLYKFLQGFSFELDRTMTYIELLLPLESGRLVSPEILLLQSLQLGLPIEPYLATKQQRRLAREALFIYQNKGTHRGTEAFIESLTGFAPDVSASPNLVLTGRESSFTNGVGFWRALNGCTITSVNTIPSVDPRVEPYVDDYRFAGEVVVTSANSRISAGTLRPKLQGIPVKAGTPYTFSGYGKTASGTMDVIGYATWYDQFGNPIPFDGTTNPSVYWPPVTFPQIPQVLDDEWIYEIAVIDAVGDGTEIVYTTDGAHDLAIGDSVIIDGIVPVGFNGRHKTITDVTTDTFTIDGSYTATFDSMESDNAVVIKRTGRFEVTAVAPGGTVDITTASIDDNLLTFTVTPYNPFVFGNTVIIKGSTNSIYDGNYIVQNYTANTISVKFTAADLPPIPFSGKVTQGYPNKGTAIVIDNASVSTNVATIQFATNHGLVANDYVEIQGLDAIFSFGVHTVLATPALDTIVIALPHPDVTYPSGYVYGTARKVFGDTATPYAPAVYAGFDLVFLDTGTVHLDLLQMATIDIEDYHEARAVETFLYPTKSNYLKNPGFAEDGMVEWTVEAEEFEVVDRTSVGHSDSGSALQVATYIPIQATGYSVSSNLVTVNIIDSTNTDVGEQVIVQPVPTVIVSAAVSSNVASIIVADPTGYSIGDILILNPVPDVPVNAFLTSLGVTFPAPFLITGVSGSTISFATTAEDGVYAPDVVPYGVCYKYTPIYGLQTIVSKASGVIRFNVTTPDTGGTVTVPMTVRHPTEIYSTTAPVVTGKHLSISMNAGLNVLSTTPTSEEFVFIATAQQIKFEYVNGTLVFLGATTLETVMSTETINNDWRRLSMRMYLDPVEPDLLFPGTLFQIQLNPVVITVGLIGLTSGQTLFLDHAQVEPTYTPTDYFDGDLPPEYGAEWEGLPHRSATHLYPNLPAKMTRLQQELPNYIAADNAFLIKIYGSKYYKSQR